MLYFQDSKSNRPTGRRRLANQTIKHLLIKETIVISCILILNSSKFIQTINPTHHVLYPTNVQQQLSNTHRPISDWSFLYYPHNCEPSSQPHEHPHGPQHHYQFQTLYNGPNHGLLPRTTQYQNAWPNQIDQQIFHNMARTLAGSVNLDHQTPETGSTKQFQHQQTTEHQLKQLQHRNFFTNQQLVLHQHPVYASPIARPPLPSAAPSPLHATTTKTIPPLQRLTTTKSETNHSQQLRSNATFQRLNVGKNPKQLRPKDIDECLDEQACGRGAVCENTPGSYRCSCPPGFTGDPSVECFGKYLSVSRESRNHTLETAGFRLQFWTLG